MQDNKAQLLHGIVKAVTTRRKSRTAGFTVVELLIVIVVIGILAAITIVAYNGIQQRARDAQRKSDIAAIEKVFKLYNIDHPDTPFMTNNSGCGGNTGNGYAWFNLSNGTNYPESMNNCLKVGGYIQQDVIDPTKTTGYGCASGSDCHAYMVSTCTGTNAGTYLYANLESLPAASTEANDSCVISWDTSYGMNYVVKIN